MAKRPPAIIGLILAVFVAALWLRVLVGNHRHYIEIPPSGDYIEGRKTTRSQVLLISDSRGIVFDVFIPEVPPKKAPGPPGSEETQRWLKPRANRTAAAYRRFFGFLESMDLRHGERLKQPFELFVPPH